MMAIAPVQMRRLMRNRAIASTTRDGSNWSQFKYPHSFGGVNPAYNHIPVEEQALQQDKTPGAKAPLAHRSIRKFPDWYKPYTFNYTSEGYLLLTSGVIMLFGYSYLNDICEQKGRNSRKIFPSELKTQYQMMRDRKFAKQRIEDNDYQFEKFKHPKERAHVAHH